MMKTYDKLVHAFTQKRNSWILLALFNLYLLMSLVHITVPALLDMTAIAFFGFLFLILLGVKHNNRNVGNYLFNAIFLIGMLLLLVFPLFVPKDWIPFAQLPLSKEPFQMYYVFVFFELVFVRNIM